MNNKEKFKEVFGFTPDIMDCVMPRMVCEEQQNRCSSCPFDDWWYKEYKECFELKEEYEDD